MPKIEILFFLLAFVTAIVLLARRLEQPYPILLVVGGLLLGFVPGLPQIELHADTVFLLFLPPLLYVDSLHTSWHDFKQSLRPILLLAVGLVLLTMAAVAGVTHLLLPDFSWPAAFVLGAIVAPTDTVAIGAIAERLHLPRRITTILQGESLVNDATAIVAYRIALGVLMGASVTPLSAFGSFVMVAAGGLAVGLAVGWATGFLRRMLPQDPPVENTISLLTPLAAYLPAEAFHLSGVLSVVACGIYLGRVGPRTISSETRLRANAMWEMITFLLNGLLFLLVGMQLKQIVSHLTAQDSAAYLIVVAVAVSLTALAVRAAWVFAATFLPRHIPAFRRGEAWHPTWQGVTVVAGSGLRGGISLAVAAALPATMDDGSAFPARNAILFVTYGVILLTLVGQGLSLPPLIRALGVEGGSEDRDEEFKARQAALAAAHERLDSYGEKEDVPENLRRDLRDFYARRERRLHAHLVAATESDAHGDDAANAPAANPLVEQAQKYYALKRDLITAEREAIVALRDRGEISDNVLRRIQFDIDLEEARIGSHEL